MPHNPEEAALKERQRRKFATLRAEGMGVVAASRECQVSRQTGSQWAKEIAEAQRVVEGRPTTLVQRTCRQCGTGLGRGTGRRRGPEVCAGCKKQARKDVDADIIPYIHSGGCGGVVHQDCKCFTCPSCAGTMIGGVCDWCATHQQEYTAGVECPECRTPLVDNDCPVCASWCAANGVAV